MECLPCGYLLSTSGSARLFIRFGYMGKRPPALRCGGGKVSQLGDVKGGAPETSPRSTWLLIPMGLSGRYQTKSKVLSHFEWVTFPFLDGSAQKHPHPNPPPSEGEGMTGGPTFLPLPRREGIEGRVRQTACL